MKNKQKKSRRRRIDVDVQELDQIVDRAREAPLSDTDYDKLKTELHALIERSLGPPKTEKLASVFADENGPASAAAPRAKLAGTRTQRRTVLHRRAQSDDCASALGWGRSLPGLRPRQGLRAEGAQGSGADRGAGAAGRNHL